MTISVQIFVQFVVMRCCGYNRDNRPSASSVDPEEAEEEEEDERRPLLSSVSDRPNGHCCPPSLKGSIQTKWNHQKPQDVDNFPVQPAD